MGSQPHGIGALERWIQEVVMQRFGMVMVVLAGLGTACDGGDLAAPLADGSQYELQAGTRIIPANRIRAFRGWNVTGVLLDDQGPYTTAVHRTPSGDCALGTGPIGSPGYLEGMMADLESCNDFCGSEAKGARAVEDGAGGCKLECQCSIAGPWGSPDDLPQVVTPF
jgi:hypothetical protein